jgi:hypothetical protein
MQAFVVRPLLIAFVALIIGGLWANGGSVALGYGSACRAGAPAAALHHGLHCRPAAD